MNIKVIQVQYQTDGMAHPDWSIEIVCATETGYTRVLAMSLDEATRLFAQLKAAIHAAEKRG